MALNDSKKIATAVNATIKMLRDVIAARDRAMAIRAAIIANGLGGKIPDGIANDLNTWLTNLNALPTEAILAKIEPYEVKSHRGAALPGEL